MKGNSTSRVVVGILALLLALPASRAFGGTTGKIMGRVTDPEGDPLPGASVIIEGTQRGTEADADGVYFLLAVPPGHHTFVASMIGYATQRKEGVVVSADFTSNAFFKLEESPVELDRVVVVADRWQRPPVEIDKTSTRYILTAEEIEQAPIIKTTGELISLQPGVDLAGTFAVRGSDIAWGNTPRAWGTLRKPSNDTCVMIDGVRVANKDGHSAILFTGVNKSAVQQISVVTGVTSAEYGDAQGGTINIVTQDGGRAAHGWMETNFHPAGKKHWGADIYDAPEHRDHMRWDDPEWLKETDPLTGRLIHVREDYTSYSGIVMEGSVSGPAGPNASFVASGKHERRACTYPAATNHGFYNDRGQYINAPNNWQASGSLTFKPTASTKIKGGLVLQRFIAFNDEINEYNYAREGFIRGTRHNLRNVFLPKNWAASGRYKHLESLAYATWTHVLSPKTFYEIRFSHGQTVQDTLGAPPYTLPSRKDVDGWFIIDRQTAMWVQSERKRLHLKADLSSQMTEKNFVKVGIEVARFDAYYTYWGARSEEDNWFTFYAGGDRPWEIGSPADPIRGALYLQDKMEFAGLITNVGVRMDFQKHGHDELMRSGMHWAPMWRRYTNRHYAYGIASGGEVGVVPSQDLARRPPTFIYFSPRLGISHPITDRMVMHFSLGRFVQWFDLYENYAKSYRNFGRIGPDGDPSWMDVNNNGRRDANETYANMDPHVSGFGADPWAHPEETLTFDVGFDWSFTADYTTSLTVFYRNETQQGAGETGLWWGPKGRWGPGGHLRGTSNGIAAYVKGVELAIRKRMSNCFSFRLSWAWGWSASGAMGLTQCGAWLHPDSTFVRSANFWYDFRYLEDGTAIAIPLTVKERQEFSHSAEAGIRSRMNQMRDNPWRSFGKIPELSHAAIYIGYGSLGGSVYGPMAPGAREKATVLGQANVQFVLNTPPDLDLGPRFLSWLVSDLSANVLWKMRTGERINWTTPGFERRRSRGPVRATTDLSLGKVFSRKGRVRPSLFLEVRNLFNDKIDATSGTDYMRWGLQMGRPNSKDYVDYGDMDDRSYYDSPRQTSLGIRVLF